MECYCLNRVVVVRPILVFVLEEKHSPSGHLKFIYHMGRTEGEKLVQRQTLSQYRRGVCIYSRVAERISNYYFVRELLWPLEFEFIYFTQWEWHAILPGSPPRGNIKGCTNHFSLSFRFPTGQQQDKPANMMEYILSSRFPTGQQQDKPAKMTEHILLSLPPSSRTSQSTWQGAFSLFAS